MKNTKKIASLLLALMCVAPGLTACGGKAVNYAAENTKFFIGATGPLTGDTADYGVSADRGAQIAIEEINANGGLNGIEFTYKMIDDVSAADKAATGYTSLYESGMQASLGSVTSGSCASFAAAAVEDNVFAITPSASAANVIATGDSIFRVCFGDPQQGEIAAETLTASYQKIGVIYDTSDPYSKGIFEAFEAKMIALGKKADTDYIVRTFDKETNKDFSTQVAALQSSGCDVMFLPIYYTEAGLIAKEAAKNGFNVLIFGCDGLDTVKEQLDDTVTATIQYITPFDVNSTDPLVQKFVAAYEAKFGTKPDQFAADGYDAVMIIYEAMKTADVKDVTISASALCDILKSTLTGGSFKYTGVTGKDMTWTKEGSCNKQANIVTINNQ